MPDRQPRNRCSQQCKLPAPLNGTRLLGQLLIDHGGIGRLLRSQIPACGSQLMRLLVRPFDLRHRQMQICCARRQAKRQRQVGQLGLLCWGQAGQVEFGKALTSSQNRLLVTAYRCHPAIEHQIVEASGLLIAALPISQVLERTRELATLDQHLNQLRAQLDVLRVSRQQQLGVTCRHRIVLALRHEGVFVLVGQHQNHQHQQNGHAHGPWPK